MDNRVGIWPGMTKEQLVEAVAKLPDGFVCYSAWESLIEDSDLAVTAAFVAPEELEDQGGQ